MVWVTFASYVAAFLFGVVLLVRYRPGPRYGAIVLFLWISVLAATVQYLFRGTNTWFVEYVYPLPQFILCAAALGHPVRRVTDMSYLLLLGTIAVLIRGPITVPETVVQTIGGAWVARVAYRAPSDGPHNALRWALMGYWGLTLPLIMGMPAAHGSPWTILPVWLQVLFVLRIGALFVIAYWLWIARRPTHA